LAKLYLEDKNIIIVNTKSRYYEKLFFRKHRPIDC
jgi:hypothetical protein